RAGAGTAAGSTRTCSPGLPGRPRSSRWSTPADRAASSRRSQRAWSLADTNRIASGPSASGRAARDQSGAMMEPLDGNAIAGELVELYGREMTTATGACANCGATAQIGALWVYVRAPGTVVRCPSCGNVVMVIVT